MFVLSRVSLMLLLFFSHPSYHPSWLCLVSRDSFSLWEEERRGLKWNERMNKNSCRSLQFPLHQCLCEYFFFYCCPNQSRCPSAWLSTEKRERERIQGKSLKLDEVSRELWESVKKKHLVSHEEWEKRERRVREGHWDSLTFGSLSTEIKETERLTKRSLLQPSLYIRRIR